MLVFQKVPQQFFEAAVIEFGNDFSGITYWQILSSNILRIIGYCAVSIALLGPELGGYKKLSSIHL